MPAAVPARTALCAAADPRSSLEDAGAALIGSVAALRTVPGQRAEFSDWVVYTIRTEEVVKGRLGATVEVWGPSENISSTLGLDVGDRVALLLHRYRGHWTSSGCGRMSASRLRAAARPLPAAARGRPVVLVGGRFGDGVRTIALNRRGEAVAYGRGGMTTFSISTCPGGRFAAEVVSSGRRSAVAVRSLPGLRLIRQVPLQADRIVCRGRDARELLVLTAAGETATVRSRIGILRGRRLTVLHAGRAQSFALQRDALYFVGGTDGRGLFRLELASARTRRVLRLPANTVQPSVSPDGRWLAAVAYSSPTGRSSPPSLLVLADLRSGRLRSVRLASSNILGESIWVAPDRFLLVTGGGDGDLARVFDTTLRVQARLGNLYGRSPIVTGGRAFALGGGGVISAPLAGGRPRLFRAFLSPETFALAPGTSALGS